MDLMHTKQLPLSGFDTHETCKIKTRINRIFMGQLGSFRSQMCISLRRGVESEEGSCEGFRRSTDNGFEVQKLEI